MCRTGRSIPLTALVAMLTLGALAACSSTESFSGQTHDAEITTKIKSKLTADPQINPFNIDVDTLSGVVTLSGAVRDEETRSEAEKLARDTKGVKDVVNRIEIVPKEDG